MQVERTNEAVLTIRHCGIAAGWEQRYLLMADVLHAELRSALDLIVAKYPDDVRRDFAFVQHDAR